MPANYKLPDPKSMLGSLEMIFGSEPEVEVVEAQPDPCYYATYIDADEQVVAVATCDLQSSAGLGCALSLIPPAGAEDMVASSELTAIAEENLFEVMNIFSSLFMDDKTPHLKLAELKKADADLASHAESMEHINLSIDSGKYQPGLISFARPA